jgi:Flp pilus assembly pilin Flp
MRWFFDLIKRLSGEDGQTLVEYALILLMIAIALVGSLTMFEGSLNGFYQTAANMFP